MEVSPTVASPRGDGSLESLRAGNRASVMDALRLRGAVSRADIARHTGLSRTTVSTLVADLQAEGLVVEQRGDNVPGGGKVGRPGVLLALDPSAGALVGIDFGHRHLRVAVSDLSYEALAEELVGLDVDHDADEALDTAARMVHSVLREAGVDRERVLAAGMGLPAPIARPSGLVSSHPILPAWIELDPAEEMGRRLGVPVVLDNDANLGALGEATFGSSNAAAADVLVYARLSAGIGAGIVIGGRVFRGANGFAGEIGHVPVDPNGRICRCGNRGCLETLVGSEAVTELLQRSHGTLTIEEVIERAVEGDAGCRRAVADAGRSTGRVLGDLCNFLNPEQVVIGGDLAAAGDLILDPLREQVEQYALPAVAESIEIRIGRLGSRAEVLGGLALASQESRGRIALDRAGVTLTTTRRREG
jgi:predicted NBD/HSP70 family sugar kinase/biotin operon repressor